MGRRERKPRKTAWVRAHDVDFLPAPPPPPEVAATSYHGPSGDVTDAEAVAMVERLREMRREWDAGQPTQDHPEPV